MAGQFDTYFFRIQAVKEPMDYFHCLCFTGSLFIRLILLIQSKISLSLYPLWLINYMFLL
jgi:hypothetical protein